MKLLSLKKEAFKRVTSIRDLPLRSPSTRESLLLMKIKVSVTGSLYSTTLMKIFSKKVK